MMHHQSDAYEKFEEISALVKQTHLKIKDPEYDYDLNLKHEEQKNPERAQWIEKSKNLINEVSYCAQ